MKKVFVILLSIFLAACTVNRKGSEVNIADDIHIFDVNESGTGPWLTLDFKRGESFYYPLMAIWLEDLEGNYIQTLYVPRSVATSIFRFGMVKDNNWEPGVRRYPQTLPYWAHKRGIRAPDGLFMPDPDSPITDAYSGATPITGFSMRTRTENPLSKPVKIMLEVNQNWDWNEYWTNDLYPDDKYYKLSCQPALVYEAVLNPAFSGNEVEMKVIGHSHHSGASGEIFPDLSTITSALRIAESIRVKLGK
ncbi:MAG: hypothetical protein QNK33_06830 [Bacteroidales bacterium]|nr:hypothetical protein [Bacteroidales bacterium]